MNDAFHPAGATFLLHETDPSRVVTPEDLGEEERMLSRALHEYAEREVRPVWDEMVSGDAEVNRRLFEKAAEMGLFMAEVPEAYGGLDLDVLAITAMCAHGGDIGALGSLIYGHQGIGTLPIVYFGTPEQVEKYLVPCMNGEMISAFALTEPGTGSDAMNITTRAVLNEAGTHYVVNGAKQWITNAGWADLFILFAKVDGEHFSAFLVERETPGLSVGEQERLLGLHGCSVAAVTLEDVEVPVENLLGEVGKGHRVAFCTLNMGRLKLAGTNTAGARKAVAVATKYAAERVQFGRPIAEFGLIQRKLAEMAAGAFASESMVYRTAGLVYQALEGLEEGGAAAAKAKLDALSEFSVECALAKVYSSEAYNGNADHAVQVFGGYGFSEEYAPARMYRDSRIARIYEGTNEICRLYAQRAIFKRAGKGGLVMRDAVRPEPNGIGEDFASLAGGIADLKQVYIRLTHRVFQKVGLEALGEPIHQQHMSSLADVAMEIFAAESCHLRVMKLVAAGGPAALQEDLTRLTLARAVDRIRTEAREILSALVGGDELRLALADIDGWLPFTPGAIEARDRVARSLVESGGQL